MKPDVTALLQVQADDLKAYGIEDRLGALLPRVAALECLCDRWPDSLNGLHGTGSRTTHRLGFPIKDDRPQNEQSKHEGCFRPKRAV